MRKITGKRTLSGFTLIEVLVAMVILAIASLVLVTMYASVAMTAKGNNQLNDRMSEQQGMIEAKKHSNDSGENYFNTVVNENLASAFAGADSAPGLQFEMVCTYNQADPSWEGKKNFVENVVVYDLKNIEDGHPVEDVNDTDELKTDFKYFVGNNSVY